MNETIKDNLPEILKSHAEWLEDPTTGKRADFSDAALRGTDFRGADFSGTDFRGADFSGADLRGANLCWSDFRGADFRGANLREADFRGANLRWSDFSGANFCWAAGNGKEVKSLQCGPYEVVYTSETLFISSKAYPIQQWWDFSDDEIDKMVPGTPSGLWKKWKPILQQIIEISPATRTGHEKVF